MLLNIIYFSFLKGQKKQKVQKIGYKEQIKKVACRGRLSPTHARDWPQITRTSASRTVCESD